MPHFTDFSISLRIVHPTCDPEFLTKAIGMKPDYSWKKGDIYVPQGSGVASIIRETSYWLKTLEHNPKLEIASAIRHFNEVFGSHSELFNQIATTNGSVEYSIGFTSKDNAGLVLEFDLLRQLVQLGMDVSLEFFPTEQEW